MPELLGIANDLGADYKSNDDKDTIIYAILDKQGEIEGKNSTAASSKRKRVRIVKKDTDRVYSVNGKEGENFDLKKSKPATARRPKNNLFIFIIICFLQLLQLINNYPLRMFQWASDQLQPL